MLKILKVTKSSGDSNSGEEWEQAHKERNQHIVTKKIINTMLWCEIQRLDEVTQRLQTLEQN